MWGYLDQIKELRAALAEIEQIAQGEGPEDDDEAFTEIIKIAQRALEVK
jgi:hypothetical protein